MALKQKATQLLISVRNGDEAAIAQSSGVAGIIDLKEPSRGSLGSVSFDTAREFCAALRPETIKSIALGEVTDGLIWPDVSDANRTDTLAGFQFAKIGLAGLREFDDWLAKWASSFASVPECVSRVAVAYADSETANSPPIDSIIESAHVANCKVLLIDTFGKGQGSLLDFVPTELLREHVRFAKQLDLKVVLAGSLRRKHIKIISQLAPDYFAVRGAVCSGDRTTKIDTAKIASLGSALAQQNRRFS